MNAFRKVGGKDGELPKYGLQVDGIQVRNDRIRPEKPRNRDRSVPNSVPDAPISGAKASKAVRVCPSLVEAESDWVIGGALAQQPLCQEPLCRVLNHIHSAYPACGSAGFLRGILEVGSIARWRRLPLLREPALKLPVFKALADPVGKKRDLRLHVISRGGFPQEADELLADQVVQGGRRPESMLQAQCDVAVGLPGWLVSHFEYSDENCALPSSLGALVRGSGLS